MRGFSASRVSGQRHGRKATRTVTQAEYTAGGKLTNTVTVDSAESAPTTATLDIPITQVVNRPPVAVDDTAYKAKKNTLLTVVAPGVLANDTDADGNPLTAVLVANASSGTLTLSPDGSFMYMPAKDFTGKVTFTYKATTAPRTATWRPLRSR